MASTASLADNPVTAWVRRNGEIFRTPPQGTDLSKRGRSFEGAVEPWKQDIVVQRAAGQRAATFSAEVSQADGVGGIKPPTSLPPASYYQDVRNHANIATTMLVTARRQVGFEPHLAGQQLSPQELQAFSDKFFKWIIELDNYWPYIDVRGTQVMALRFHSGNENLINEDVSKFVGSFSGLKNEVVQAWRQYLTGIVKRASAFVTQQGADVSQVSFQMDILDTSGDANAVQPLTFGRTVQSDPPYGKNDSVLTSGATYLVNSNAIIASAHDFAQNGLSLFGVKDYVAYVNTGNSIP